MKPKHYSILATVVLVAAAAFALVHGFRGQRYAGFNSQEYVGLFEGPSIALDFFLAGLWGAGAFALIFRKSVPSFVVAGLGAFALLCHGLLVSLATTSTVGLVFIGAALGLAFLLKRAWATGLRAPRIASASVANEVPRTSRLSWTS